MNKLNELRTRAKGLTLLFYPSSIAIVGASGELTKPGGIILAHLLKFGFKGKLFPVNPTLKDVNGLECYPAVNDIPGQVDMAIIAVAVSRVMKILVDCVAKGVKGVIIITSGFSEVGGKGIELQRELKEFAGKHGIRICGPNCMGLINYLNNMMAAFSFAEILPHNSPNATPNVSFVTQSGGFGLSTAITAAIQGIGFTYFVGTGNEVESDFSDFMAFSVDDQQTKIIAGYMEGVRDGLKFALAADMAMEAKKPVVIFKTGRYQPSASAALSHTGSMTGSDKVYSSFFRQKGIIRPESIEEMAAVLTLLETKAIPPGKKVGIIASSGGHGVVMADLCVEAGLELAVLSEETRRKLAEWLPPHASVANPVDFTGMDLVNDGLLQACTGIMADDPEVDFIVFSYWVSRNLEATAREELIKTIKSVSKPVIAVIMSVAGEAVLEHTVYLRGQGIPVTIGLEPAVKAIRKVYDYSVKASSVKREIIRPAGSGAVREVEKLLAGVPAGAAISGKMAGEILSAYGVQFAGEGCAASVGEAVELAGKMGYPVALKIDSPDIPHKTEARGIKLNLASAGQVEEAYKEIMANAMKYNPGAKVKGVLVQEMLKEGTEVIVGIGRDPAFGPTVLFGLGGIFVEQLGDVSLRVAPVCENDAWEMLQEIKGSGILDGVRGKPPVDKKAIVDIILRLSQLAEDFPRIAELDINPLIVFEEGKGARAVDALIVTK